MKYYLIVGYQLQEKHLTFPTVHVSVNDTLVDHFLCDNEQSITLENVYNEYIILSGATHKKTVKNTTTHTYSTPSKLQIYELDSATLENPDSVLKIEVTNNYSDYTNGFLNKRSLAVFSPIFLIPKDLLHNRDSMYKLIKKICYLSGKVPGTRDRTRNYRLAERVVWPGYSLHADHVVYATNNAVPTVGGGNFKILLNIKKRLGLHFLTHHNKIPKGFFFCDDFFQAWYQWQSKKYFTIDARVDHNSDKQKSVPPTLDITIKNDINTDDEDQRSSTKD